MFQLERGLKHTVAFTSRLTDRQCELMKNEQVVWLQTRHKDLTITKTISRLREFKWPQFPSIHTVYVVLFVLPL